MKAVIIAAGKGTRMRGFTRELPKCLAIVLNGKSLLETQLEVLRFCGISDISVVRGYKAEKINYPGIRYYFNDRYEGNNILESLFYAEREMDGSVIISYGDIWYGADIVEKLAQATGDITLAVDVQWRDTYLGRKEHPVEEAELVRWNENQEVTDIGKIGLEAGRIDGEFIGMMKLSPTGCKIFKECFHRARDLFARKPFQRSPLFEKAYLTDLLQEMADQDISIHCAVVGNEWREIDTLEDLDRVSEFMKKRRERLGSTPVT